MKEARIGKKLFVITILSFLTFMHLSSGSSYAAGWAKTYGSSGYEQANAVQQTSDGGYIMAGSTSSFGAGGDDVWIVKLDRDGTVQWQKAFGGSSFDEARSIQQTEDGGYIVAGETLSFGEGDSDAWILKLDSSGDLTWQKRYGGIGKDTANSIVQTSDGGYILAGETSSFGAGGDDVWIVKLDKNGAIQWQKTFGGDLADSAHSIRQTSDGGYIIAGVTWSFGAGSGDAMVMKLDRSGNITWQRTIGGSAYDEINSIQNASDGGYIAAGMTKSFGAGNGDFWVIKFSGDGAVAWQKTYGGGLDDWANSIQQTSDGGYIVAGVTFSFGVGNGDFWILKLSADGAVQWQRTFGSGDYDEAFSVQNIPDGYVVAGRTWATGLTLYDAWVLKLDTSGDITGCTAGFTRMTEVSGSDTKASLTVPNMAFGDTTVIPLDTAVFSTVSAVVPSDACVYVEPNISTNTTSLDLGEVAVGSSSVQTLVISNTGTGALAITSLPLSGGSAGDFSLTSCSSIQVGDTCTISVTFTPSSAGNKGASLDISSNDPDTPVVHVALSGTGVSGTVVKMVVPSAQGSFSYPAVESPQLNTDPSLAKPFSVGNTTSGILSLRVGFVDFAGPVDIYLALQASGSYDVWLIRPDLTLQRLSQGQLTPWRSGDSAIDEALYGKIPLSTLPPGTYNLYAAVTPKGRLDAYYLWSTFFTVPEIFAAKMPVPVSAESFSSSAVSSPLFNPDPGIAKPFSVGDTAGGTLGLGVGLLPFTGPVDIYLAVQLPSSPEVWLIRPDLTLQAASQASSQGLLPWKSGAGGAAESLYSDILLKDLPRGTYHFYTAVTPKDRLDAYYLWISSLDLP